MATFKKFLSLFSGKSPVVETPEEIASREKSNEKHRLRVEQQTKAQEIQKEMIYFVESGNLEQLTQYLDAGAKLWPDTISKIFAEQPEWLDTKYIKNYMEEHCQEELMFIILYGFSNFQHEYRFYENNAVAKSGRSENTSKLLDLFGKSVPALKLSAQALTVFSSTFENNPVIFESYQKSHISMRNVFREAKENALEISISDYRDLFLKNMQQFEHLMKTQFSLLQKSALSDKISSIQAAYRDSNPVVNLQENLKRNLEQKISGIQKSSIPEVAWEKIENIHNKGIELIKYADKLSTEDNFNIKNLTQKVLFEVIQGYVSVLPEFKNQLTNQDGKNLDQLFMESLDKIEAQLQDKLEVVAQSQFKDVKTTHQYLSAKR